LLKDFWDGFNDNVAVVSEKKITDIIIYLEEVLDFHLFGEKSENNKSKNCGSCSTGKLGLRLSKFGAFLACSNYPDCTFKKQISSSDNENMDGLIDEGKTLGIDEAGFEIVLKRGPYGTYVQSSEEIHQQQEKKSKKLVKPKLKRASLPPNISPADITLPLAIRLLQLPTKLCEYPVDHQDVILGIGRFGPYLKCFDRFISIPKKYDPFTITPEMAFEIIEASNNRLLNKQNKNIESAKIKPIAKKNIKTKKIVRNKKTK
jgi:DNA topoisomerase-1